MSNCSRFSPGRWETKLGRKHGSDGDKEPQVSLRSHSPSFEKHADASCDNFAYPMPTCWSKSRNVFIAGKLVIAKQMPDLICSADARPLVLHV